MGRRNKLQKFAEIITFSNVYENINQDDPNNNQLQIAQGQMVEMKGKWVSHHFHNNHPLILECACGRGEYSIALARKYKNTNFIGVDVKGARIWQGAKIAMADGLENVAFLRTRIERIQGFFDKNEVSEIWITFPDPFLKESKSDRRLTSPPFLERYRQIVKNGGLLHLKTDDPTLYEYSLESLNECSFLEIEYSNRDIYSEPLKYPELEHKTFYEAMHLKAEKKIKYIRCRFL